MKSYIKNLLVKLNHPMPRKPQLSPHKFHEVKYASKTQLAHKDDTSKPLNDTGIRRVQTIVGALLWIGRAVNNKLLVSLSAIVSQQASAGIDLDWNYAKKHCDRTFRLSMKNYIKILLVKLNHPMPSKPQLSPQNLSVLTLSRS